MTVKKVCPLCHEEFEGGEVFCPNDGGRLSTPSQIDGLSEENDPLVGATLDGRYRVKRRIGEGGMGIVYEGQHIVIDKRMAIKVLRDDFSRRPDVVERFRQEARSASRIQNHHIVDISDFGETPGGESYFVMEFLEGEDVSNVIERETTLSPERTVRLALQCCDALGAAHEAGIIHRDMKPENIYLVRRGQQEDFVKIVDFGIAKMSDIETDGSPSRKLTKTGMIFGTPEYMSPEQASGKDLDHRVDVYAMGVILFEMLTGRVPFVGDTFMGILTQQMFEPPPSMLDVNPHTICPEPLAAVIYKALAKDPAQRHQDMAELARDLKKAVDLGAGPVEGTYLGYGEPVRPVGSVPDMKESDGAMTSWMPKAAASKKGLYGVVGAGVILASLGIAAAMMRSPTPEKEPIPEGKAPPAPAVATPPPEPVVDEPKTVEVSIDLQPADAEVFFVDGKDQRTPIACQPSENGFCMLTIERGKPVRITAAADGYEDPTPIAKTFNEPDTVTLHLDKKRKARPSKPAPARNPNQVGGSIDELKAFPPK